MVDGPDVSTITVPETEMELEETPEQRLNRLAVELGSEDFETATAAKDGIEKMGGKAVPALIAALKGESANVRSKALDILANHKTKPVIEAAIPLLKDAVADVREAAASCLARIGDRAAVPALIEAVPDGDENVRDEVGVALESLCDHSLEEPEEGELTPAQEQKMWREFWAAAQKGEAAGAKGEPLVCAEKDQAGKVLRYRCAGCWENLGGKKLEVGAACPRCRRQVVAASELFHEHQHRHGDGTIHSHPHFIENPDVPGIPGHHGTDASHQKLDYDRAVAMYKAGQLKEAKPLFVRVSKELAELQLPNLHWLQGEWILELKGYLGRIDSDIAAAEAKRKAEEARKMAEEEARRKAEEARRKAVAEAKAKAAAEAAAKKKAEEEAKAKAAAEAAAKAAAEAAAKKKAEEEAKAKAAAEAAAKKKAEEEAKRKKAEEEAKAKAAAEAKAKAAEKKPAAEAKPATKAPTEKKPAAEAKPATKAPAEKKPAATKPAKAPAKPAPKAGAETKKEEPAKIEAK